MRSATLACGYRREIISTSSSPASRSALLPSCSWAVQRSQQGSILQEHGGLKHGCQTRADVPEVTGMVESQHVAVHLGGWLVDLHLWLKQHEAVGASGPGFPPFSLRTVPNGLQTPPEQGVRDPAASRGRSCRGMAAGGGSLIPPRQHPSAPACPPGRSQHRLVPPCTDPAAQSLGDGK